MATATIASSKKDWREDFFEFGDVIYFNLAGQTPIPRVSAKALEKASDWKKLPHVIEDSLFFSLPAHIRELLAKLIGGVPEEFAVTSGASAGLQAAARGIDWKPQDEVLIARGEFPAHWSTFLPLAQSGKLKVRVIEPAGRFLTTEDVVAAIGPQTKLISMSHVRFDDSARFNPRPVADAVHKVGGYLLLDVSQSAGAVPMNIRETGADFAVCAGYKWLLSAYGTGFFWVRKELIDQLVKQPFYWTAHKDAGDFNALTNVGADYGPTPAHAGRWDAPETTAFFNLAVMEASLEYVLRVGVETVWQHNTALTEQLFDRLPVDRCVCASPREQGLRGPYGCIAGRSPESTKQIYEKLRAAKIYPSMRGGAIRVSPYLYNSERDIERLIEVISQ